MHEVTDGVVQIDNSCQCKQLISRVCEENCLASYSYGREGDSPHHVDDHKDNYHQSYKQRRSNHCTSYGIRVITRAGWGGDGREGREGRERRGGEGRGGEGRRGEGMIKNIIFHHKAL